MLFYFPHTLSPHFARGSIATSPTLIFISPPHLANGRRPRTSPRNSGLLPVREGQNKARRRAVAVHHPAARDVVAVHGACLCRPGWSGAEVR